MRALIPQPAFPRWGRSDPILAPIGSLGKLEAKDRPRVWYRPHPALKNGDLSVIWTHVPREFVPNP
jgi:hypothetical protein